MIKTQNGQKEKCAQVVHFKCDIKGDAGFFAKINYEAELMYFFYTIEKFSLTFVPFISSGAK